MFTDALFHLHTRRTDGALDVGDYFDFAAAHAVPRVIFLEHVRRKATYDVRAFAAEVRDASAKCGIPAVVGFEAKILSDGTLDIGDDALSVADVIGAAEHGSAPPDVFATYRAMVASAPSSVLPRQLVWVHPGLWLRRSGLIDDNWHKLEECLSLADHAGVYIEHNLRYDLYPGTRPFAFQHRCTGADAHTSADLARWLAWRSRA